MLREDCLLHRKYIIVIFVLFQISVLPALTTHYYWLYLVTVPSWTFFFGSVVIVAVVALFSSNTWCCPTWDDIETCFSFLFTIHLRMDECRITVNTSMDVYLATLLLLLPVVNFIYEGKANIINYFILFHFCCSRISIVLLSQRSSQCIKFTVLVCLLLSVVVCI